MSQQLAKNEAAKPLATSSSVDLPEHLRDVSSTAGGENVRPEDFKPPRLAICQSMSPERKSGKKFIEGLKEGDIFDSTGKNYGRSIDLIPLTYQPSRIFFEDKVPICRSLDAIKPIDGGISPTCAACPHSKFTGKGADREAPACTEFINFAVIPTGQVFPFIFSFKSSSLDEARNWIQKLKMLIGPDSKPKPWFSSVYTLNSVDAHSDKGDYATPAVKRKDWVRESAVYKLAEETFQLLKVNASKVAEAAAANEVEAEKEEDIPF